MALKTFILDAALGIAATVKDSFTSATAEDRALVVTLSPNQQPIPVTSAALNASAGLVAGLVALGGGSAGTLNAIRATTYNEQTTNAARSISSSSASDTAASVGAQVVDLVYFTSDGSGPYTDQIVLNGTTPVNTQNDVCFIEKMVVRRVGSTGRNVGTITLFASTGGGGGTVGTIGIGNLVAAQGDNTTLWAHHYIPVGKIASLSTVVAGMAVGTGSATGTYFLKAKKLGVSNAAEILISDLLIVATGAGLVRQLGIAIRVLGPAKITGYAVPASNNTTCDMSFDYSEI